MRQIITPLPKVAERQKSTSPKSSVRSSPSETPLSLGDLAMETPVPRRHSLATASLLRKGASPPLSSTGIRRQLSHPISATGHRMETPPSHEPPPAAVDPSTLTSFPGPPITHSLSSSPMSLNSYAFAMMDVIDPSPINVTPTAMTTPIGLSRYFSRRKRCKFSSLACPLNRLKSRLSE